MTASPAIGETPQSAPAPRLLVELPSRRHTFFANLRDLISPRQLPPLELQSAPAPFWHDVFVKRGMPWRRFLDSGICHVVACGILIGVSRLIALQPRVMVKPAFDHADVVYYRAEEYLPPLDTRSARDSQPSKADPEFSRQPIISVPAEADNRAQTIVAAPNIKLKHDVALPNIVAWSDKAERPQLEIPAAPLTLAADLSRIAPRVERSVVAAPPDAAHLTDRRQQRTLQSAVVAPPAELRDVRQSQTLQAPIDVTPPPPSVQAATTRPVGDLNIGRSAVIAPAPQLAVGEQRTVARGGAARGVASAVVAPPPSLSGSGGPGSSGASFGARGRVIVLNLHPAVGAPPNPPAGNRRGTFAATPDGHSGASGSVGSVGSAETGAGNGRGKDAGSGSKRTGSGDLPAGLYVGNTRGKTSVVAGDASGKTASVNSANAKQPTGTTPRAASPSRTQTESAGKLSATEKEVFGNRKFYSLTLNMPNLNSAGGSWVIRFAELDRSAVHGANRDDSIPAADLSQPAATKKVDPAYPMQLMRENVAGTVILYAIIHTDGTVGSVRVLRGVDDRLDQFASEAIAQWKFQPATKNGAPVDVEATFQIPFKPGPVGSNF